MNESTVGVKSDRNGNRWGRTASLDWIVAGSLASIALVLYASTRAPGLLLGDSAEFQMAAWRFGLAHPTGYPLYLLAGGGWQRLLALFDISPAGALNSFSVVCGALAVAVTYLLGVAWHPRPLLVGRMAGLLAAGWLAFNPTAWSQSLVAEVYALNLLLLALVWRVAAVPTEDRVGMGRLWILALLTGLAVGHHRTALFLLPGLVVTLWLQRSRWPRLTAPLVWGSGLVGLLLPQLLYLYVPLRSGPAASPWYYPSLGAQQLDLYDGFWAYVTGSGFSGVLRSPAAALDQLPIASELWHSHFGWFGIWLMVVGLVFCLIRRQWAWLALLLSYGILLQLFNLFYGIGDIDAYYTPLYLVGALLVGVGLAYLAQAMAQQWPGRAFLLLALCLGTGLIMPVRTLLSAYGEVDRSQDRRARELWQPILAANPAQGALLLSNDRDEMVPLLYMQAVEGTRPDLTPLFPLMTADPDFAHIGAVAERALTSRQPVYLIKAMPGMEAGFRLRPATFPLTQIDTRPWDTQGLLPLDRAYGPMILQAMALIRRGEDELDVILHWQVTQAPRGNLTTTVQLLNDRGEKIAQHDAPPGYPFLPTSLWSQGQIYRDEHRLTVPAEASPRTLLIAMYWSGTLELLAPPMEVAWPEAE